MELARDVLDKQLVGHGKKNLGRADGIIFEWCHDQPPRLVRIESGLPAALRSIHPLLARWARAIGRRWGVRRGRVMRIPWSRVKGIGINVILDIEAPQSQAWAWERWLLDHVHRGIPGSARKR